MQSPRNKREERLLKNLNNLIIEIWSAEKFKRAHMKHVAEITDTTINNLKKGKQTSTLNIVRLADALGYEVVLARRTGTKNWADDPDVLNKIKQSKIKERNAKRRERDQPEHPLPTRIRIKRPKDGIEIIIASRRQQVIDHKSNEDDFLGVNGSGDEVPGSPL